MFLRIGRRFLTMIIQHKVSIRNTFILTGRCGNAKVLPDILLESIDVVSEVDLYLLCGGWVFTKQEERFDSHDGQNELIEVCLGECLYGVLYTQRSR